MIVGKKEILTNEKETKIPFFVIIFGSLYILIQIRVEVKHRFCFLKNPIIINFQKSKKAYIVPIQSP
jgi:hypothetical protein